VSYVLFQTIAPADDHRWFANGDRHLDRTGYVPGISEYLFLDTDEVYFSTEPIDVFSDYKPPQWSDTGLPPNLLDDERFSQFGLTSRSAADPLFFTTEGALFGVPSSMANYLEAGEVESWVPITGGIVYSIRSTDEDEPTLKVSDGTFEGTKEVLTVSGESLSLHEIFKWNDVAFAVAETASEGMELWWLQLIESEPPIEPDLYVHMRSNFDVAEQSELRLSATLTNGDITYRWDLDNDGEFDDASGRRVVVPWAEIAAYKSGTPNPIAVLAEGPNGETRVMHSTFRIRNLPPTNLEVDVPLFVNVGQSFALSVTAEDTDPLLYSVSVRDGGEWPAQSDSQFMLEFDEPGRKTLVVNATDDDGRNIVEHFTVDVFAHNGDFNGDGNVNFADFLILSANFNSVDAKPNQGDLNGDQNIDDFDFWLFRKTYGHDV